MLLLLLFFFFCTFWNLINTHTFTHGLTHFECQVWNKQDRGYPYVFGLYWARQYTSAEFSFPTSAVAKPILFHSRGNTAKRGAWMLLGKASRSIDSRHQHTEPRFCQSLRPTTVFFYSAVSNIFSRLDRSLWNSSSWTWLHCLINTIPPHRLNLNHQCLPHYHLVQIHISINSRKWMDVCEFVIDCIQF